MAKILFIAGNSRSLVANRGDLIRQMRERGHEVCAVVPSYDLMRDIDDLDIQWSSYSLSRSGLNPISDLSSVFQLIKAIRKSEANVVFAYTIKPVVYGVPAAFLAGVQQRYAMITGLGYLFSGNSFKQRALRLVAQALYACSLSFTRAVFFQNPDDEHLFRARKLLRRDKKSVLVNGSGVNLERFAVAPVVSDPPIFLCVARLLRDKGILEFVQAAHELKVKYPHARFQVLGPHDPALPNALTSQELTQLRDNPAMEFLGHQVDVRPFVAAANVFVLPSYREGTPRAVLEAMSMGRAIITTDAPGCRQTVVHGVNGYLVEPRSAHSLSEAMEAFIVDPSQAERMGAASRRLVEENFDVRAVNAQILETMDL